MGRKWLLPAAAAAVLCLWFALSGTRHAPVPAGDLPPLVTRPGVAREVAPDALDLNTATEEQLRTLPAIGAERSRNIVAYRDQNGPFRSPEELAAVEDIGPGTLEKVRERICVILQEELP
ncbi:MAG: helix-hairpin-helix domain-containing protein [Clostridia bacterium]|nr:helix-hairpin-helix domain-containing protein [Clostridia bacterium]